MNKLKEEDGFTLIEMLIISNTKNGKWRNHSVYTGRTAVAKCIKSQKDHIYFHFR